MEDEIVAYNDDIDNTTMASSWIDNSTTTSNCTGGNCSTPATCRFPGHFYAMGVIIPSGFLCNLFCLSVFSLSVGLRRTTTGHYLTAVACADILFLIGDFMRWLNTEGCSPLTFMHTSNVVCKLIFWLRYGAKLVSAWVIVAIATERFITVAFPLKVSQWSTVIRARIVIVTIFVVGLSLGSYTVWTVGSHTPAMTHLNTKCVIINKAVYDPWSMAILRVGTLGLPGFLITILTTVTVVILMRASRRRREHMEGQPVLSAGQSNLRKTSSVTTRSTSSAERQLTVTLVTVCVAFSVLRLPYTITYYLSEVVGQKHRSASLVLATRVTDVIATSNYVVNLLLYCLCGSYFRQQVLVVYGCRRRRWPGNPFGSASGKQSGIGMNAIMRNTTEFSCKSRSSTITRSSIV